MARVTTEIRDHIAYVRLTRADKRNAVDPEMAEAIVAAGQALLDADIRAVVLSGEGKAFCAGLDVMSFAQLAAGDPEALILPRTHGTGNLFQAVAMVWRQVPVPVIAALRGVSACAWGGCADCGPGDGTRDHGDEMGVDPGHGRHGALATSHPL